MVLVGFGLRTDDGDLKVVKRVEEVLLGLFLSYLAQLQPRHHDLQFLCGFLLGRFLKRNLYWLFLFEKRVSVGCRRWLVLFCDMRHVLEHSTHWRVILLEFRLEVIDHLLFDSPTLLQADVLLAVSSRRVCVVLELRAVRARVKETFCSFGMYGRKIISEGYQGYKYSSQSYTLQHCHYGVSCLVALFEADLQLALHAVSSHYSLPNEQKTQQQVLHCYTETQRLTRGLLFLPFSHIKNQGRYFESNDDNSCCKLHSIDLFGICVIFEREVGVRTVGIEGISESRPILYEIVGEGEQ